MKKPSPGLRATSLPHDEGRAPSGRDSIRIGLISDTHGLVRPGALAALEGCAAILHAGDVGKPEVLDALRRVAPLTAIRGNVDLRWAHSLPDTLEVMLAQRRFYLLHDLKALDFDPAARGIDVVVSGHSHRPAVERRDGVLYVNPGSAGPRRFRLPIALAVLDVGPDSVQPTIVELAP